ncbi:AMP-binding protein [Thalassospiraceae bacterium LMO-JJ14]|nr:AMP-binding protein [Thalassospiraceae bacterium LMO-JJ14]
MNEFAGKTYAEAISMVCTRYADRKALVFQGMHYSFADIKDEIDNASRRLLELGLRRGDKISVWMPNCPEFIFIWMGASQIGLVTVMLNTRLRIEEAQYQIMQSDSRAVVVPGGGAYRDFLGDVLTMLPKDSGAAGAGIGGGNLPMLEYIITTGLKGEHGPGMYHWPDITFAENSAIDYETDPQAPAQIVYSSGTTALPKGVMLSHAVWRKAADHGARFYQNPDDQLYLCIPLFSILSTVNGVMTFWVGGSSVALDDQFDAERLLSTVQAERSTAIYLLPVMMNRMLELPDFDSYDISSLRTGILLTLERDVYMTAVEKFGIDGVFTSYGMTETSSACTRTWADDPLETRITTHGKPLPDIEVRIADPDTNRELPPGQIGEIQVRGYNTMIGYYNKPEETARAFTADRWYKTGDAGEMLSDGSFRFISRLVDGYKHKGFNVSTAEVETVLSRHPSVAEAAVTAIPHKDFGEVGVAFVILAPDTAFDEAGMIEFVKEHLATFKVPAHVFETDSFPTTSGTGKVQKFKLREQALELLQAK